nr:flagellin lysine-N-methylase [Acetatifactor sp.]
MIYRKQKDYDTFRCIAGKCPKSCCIGWQIMIDEQSLDKYKAVNGPFSERIRSAVDYPAECFRQHGTRCNMLNECGLCDLQSVMGEDYLCDT